MVIEKDRVVMIDYTLTNDDGDMLDTSDGKAPLAYLHGHQNIIIGLEDALDGKNIDDEFHVTVEPQDAYGEWDDSLIQVVTREEFGEDEPQLGEQFRIQSNKGIHVATVTEINGDDITIDANHPLAGQTLHFDVVVREIREATKEELTHGHVHGPDDDHHH